MPLHIVRNDITKMSVDAIVNAANKTLLGGGGVDGAIHRAAGPALRVACALLGGCKTGEAKLTQGFRLPCKYVIHTVGPVWQGGGHGEKEMLAACYRNALELAQQHGCESVAFPLISSGAYGYPKDQALQVAMDTVAGFLLKQEMEVYLVVFDRQSFQISEKLFSDIASYIDERYVQLHEDHANRRMYRAQAAKAVWEESEALPMPCAVRNSRSLDEALMQMDESFSDMLLRKIDERGMKDSACYKKANIDRKLFSKIRSDRLYKPSKPTVLAFAIALELSLEETEDLLKKAGFALSHSNKFDIIVEYFISRGTYDIHMINEALFAFDQSLLGA